MSAKVGPIVREVSGGYRVEAQTRGGHPTTVFVPDGCDLTREGMPVRRFAWMPLHWLAGRSLREWKPERPLFPLAKVQP